jgi:3-hydroxyacyl-CoA dehydrogenase
MNYEDRFFNVSILGAAGKMGSGILLLTAVEMANLKLKPGNREKPFILNAIDVSPEGLSGLYGYLKVQVRKIAEKRIVELRNVYKENAELIENSEIIDQYIEDVLKLVLFSTRIESAYESCLIFEAVIEDSEVKIQIFSRILENNKKNPWFLTNTSSVPIAELNSGAGINGNIIGFHFYNPPAVQKLVELITTPETNKELIEFSKAFALKLNKKLVPSNDFAGFIGNGHFMRDLLYGIKTAENLNKNLSFVGSVFAVNMISQDFLIRPMGIFQLMDYVGVDVCQKILHVMKLRSKDDSLHSSLIDRLIDLGIKGGQNSDGSQKQGIFSYEKGTPVAVYDPEKKQYQNIESIKLLIDKQLEKVPVSHKPWKEVVGDRNRNEFLSNYFKDLKNLNTKGSQMAVDYLLYSKKIGLDLVKNGIANNGDHVNTVMLTGFFHAYGPINDFLD